MEDGLPLRHKRRICVAFVILGTLLVDAPRHDIDHVIDDSTRILQPHRHTPFLRFPSQETGIVDRIRGREAQTVVIVVPVHAIWIDAIATLGLGHVEPGLHDRSDGRVRRTQPVFARPAVQLFPERRFGELGGVRAGVFVGAGTEVADHFAARAVEGADCGGGVVEEVDVVDGDGDICVFDGGGEHDLPGGAGGGLPDGARVGGGSRDGRGSRGCGCMSVCWC